MSLKTGIALFTYNRPEHTQKVLEGLKSNKIEKLYVFIDGIKYKEHELNVNKVKEIISKIDWCEKEIIVSKNNKGLANSIIQGVNYILEKHERVIVLEDDCVPTSDFFEFMEACLDKYEDYENIMTVNGYKYPYQIYGEYEYDIFFTPLTTSWGWATWKNKWTLFDRNNDILKIINSNKELKRKINYINEGLIGMLKMQINGYLDSWAIYWTLIIIINNGICISPKTSKIINIGLDGSGVHCRDLEKYKIDNTEEINNIDFPVDIIIDEEILRSNHEFFRIGVKGKLKYFILNTIKSKKLYRLLKKYFR